MVQIWLLFMYKIKVARQSQPAMWLDQGPLDQTLKYLKRFYVDVVEFIRQFGLFMISAFALICLTSVQFAIEIMFRIPLLF